MMTHPREEPPDPGGDPNRDQLLAAADWLARMLDTAIPVPGTRLRIGVDPLLGFMSLKWPGSGDALVSLIGSVILLLATRLRVPKIVLVRMSLNMLLNGAIGAIPVFGDVFSVWFRSNARNAALLRRAAASSPRPSTVWDWVFVLGVLDVTMGLIVGVAIAILLLIARLWQLVNPV